MFSTPPSLYQSCLPSNGKLILEASKENLQFENGEVKYDNFSKAYDKSLRDPRNKNNRATQQWISRKVYAIPGIIVGVVKTIYHLFLALLGATILKNVYVSFGKKQFFLARRDRQEMFGHLSILFNDQLGLYHLQESEFQKNCYNAYVGSRSIPRQPDREPRKSGSSSNSEPSFSYSSSASTGRYGELVNSALQKTTLLAYKQMSVLERQQLINNVSRGFLTASPIDKALQNLKDKGIDLDALLQNTSDQLLTRFTLEDLLYFDLSPLKFALMAEQELEELKVEDLADLPIPTISNLREIYRPLFAKRAIDPASMVPMNSINLNTRIIDIPRFTSRYIPNQSTTIPLIAFVFFTDEQIVNLPFTENTVIQNRYLFSFLNGDEMERRFNRFQASIISAMYAHVFRGEFLTHIPANWFTIIQISQLDKETISDLFREFYNDEKIATDMVRFANFAVGDFIAALKDGKLNAYQLRLISLEQRRAVKLSELDARIIQSWFPDQYNQQSIDRDTNWFADFDAADVCIAIKAGKLNTYQLRLTSSEQRHAVKLSELDVRIIQSWFPYQYNQQSIDRDTNWFADFDAADVCVAIRTGKLNAYQLKLANLNAIPTTIDTLD